MTDFYTTIMARSSVRDYAPEPMAAEQREALEAMCAEATAPFGGRVRIVLAGFADGATRSPGTYGVIHGARDYFVVATDGTPEAKLSAGFAFERIVLEATAMGLGTCWLAATFRGTPFARAAALEEGMEVTAVSPLGVASGRRHLLERLTRTLVRESSRKPFDALFQGATERFGRALEAVRRAPSSVNSQPWRAVVRDGRVDFYYAGRSNCVMLDMGIALCHFALVCAQDGVAGSFGMLPEPPESSGNTYLRSYFIK